MFSIGLRVLGMIAFAIAMLSPIAQRPQAAEQNDPWPELVRDVFAGRPLADGTGLVAIEMPARAEDAGIVPVTLNATIPPGDKRTPVAFTLIIDMNPAPVAASFKVGPGVTAISTRVRVNDYTNVHAVAEFSDGQLYVVSTFVKASGGCSAPMGKNSEAATANLGEMRFRQIVGSSAGYEAQIMIRHPNNSGLQRDQVTRLYIPLFIVRELRLWQGDQLLFEMEGGISISEDPNFRISYRPNGAATFHAEAIDTQGHVFRGEWRAEPAG